MIPFVLHRSLSCVIACFDVRQWERGDTSHGWLFKSGFEKPVHDDSRRVAESGA